MTALLAVILNLKCTLHGLNVRNSSTPIFLTFADKFVHDDSLHKRHHISNFTFQKIH